MFYGPFCVMPRTTLDSPQNNGPLSESKNALDHLTFGSTPKEDVRRTPDYPLKIRRTSTTVKEENDNPAPELSLVLGR